MFFDDCWIGTEEVQESDYSVNYVCDIVSLLVGDGW